MAHGNPSGVRYTRLRLRDGYAVAWWGTLYGYVLRSVDGWTVEPIREDPVVVWARYRTRDDASRDLLGRAGILL